MGMQLPIIAVVTRKTRMQSLKRRWVTSGAFGFRMQQAQNLEVERRARAIKKKGGKLSDEVLAQLADDVDDLADEDEFADEDLVYTEQLKEILLEMDIGFPIRTIDRSQIATFDFGRCMAVVVVGQDGLVANTAKYVGNLPIIGINPDPTRNDGILLPFEPKQARSAVQRVVDVKFETRSITLAEVHTNDGQQMLAFNDFFLGCRSHTSARYTIQDAGKSESQSSSGIIVSTGAGSTGWFSSLVNMTNGIAKFLGKGVEEKVKVNWEDPRLVWAVREPFRSRHSGIDLVAGYIEQGDELVVGSQITGNGVIFSDGIEEDFLEFNSGTIARFSVANQRAKLVTP
jgi:NAD kinase